LTKKISFIEIKQLEKANYGEYVKSRKNSIFKKYDNEKSQNLRNETRKILNQNEHIEIMSRNSKEKADNVSCENTILKSFII